MKRILFIPNRMTKLIMPEGNAKIKRKAVKNTERLFNHFVGMSAIYWTKQSIAQVKTAKENA